ncbi:hypothetical protein SERLA73DRAFT_187752 [Serpula lacrymans var. lacrymans S7.3]|uniref:Cytochrome P450 n=2 Tax=Serpula lacrymans var. lacrymans TaxID=341189 RepID=F8QAA8_SERL3|nr:uncharacterized protein SERLADRAFT_477535 [Serpula lacrymans var. lacrymans S7.9]EGN94698.1 hypothetical protein SERLA73DRAFT_187752 [Serpula lacrymans var. lacrymans S7.3]EGO20176.1 hypothetical protein SERLADRAFT_477535 [Serpula lacrymans var. lacrymans S7.9]
MASDLPLSYNLAGSLVAFAGYCAWRSYSSRQYNLPPGPRPDPIIGNLRQFPQANQEKVFGEWGKEFGDVIYMQVFGQGVLVLNSVQAAHDLLETRGSIYSDRPRFVALGELMGWESVVTQMPYGDRFRRHRRLIQDHFSRSMVESFRPIQTQEVHNLLNGLLENPELFSTHIRRFAAGTIMQIAYGHTVDSVEDKYIKLADEALTATVNYGSPGSQLVDLVPALKYLPVWMPGTGFKRRASVVYKLVRAMIETPFEMVKSKMYLGTCTPCFTSSLLENYEKTFDHMDAAEAEEDIRAAAGVLYAAGSDTIASTLHTFILAMAMYPDIYKKVQEEIDRVTGTSRLPNLEDRANLPYLSCVMKEVHRWNPPVPLAMPHKLMTKDDEYRGYIIPKDTTVLANVWAMMKDPEIYPEPTKFRPERFMEMTKEDAERYDPREAVFGFGRRICPGKLLADTGFFLAASRIAATLSISGVFDESGNGPCAAFAGDLVSHPRPFKCDIKPRSESWRQLILEEDNQAASV